MSTSATTVAGREPAVSAKPAMTAVSPAGRAALDAARPVHDDALESALTDAEGMPELADLVKAVTG